MPSRPGQIPLEHEADLQKIKDAFENASLYHISDADKEDDWYAVFMEIGQSIWQQCKEHPDLFRFILYTAAGAITVPILLQIAGFGLSGVVARSFAAWWQSKIGNVAMKSLFAYLTRIGMLPATAAETGALIGFGVFVWVELKRTFFPRPDTENGGSGDKDSGDPGNSGDGGEGVKKKKNSACGMRDMNPLSIGDDFFSEVSKNPQVEDFVLSIPPTLLMTHIFLRIAGFTSMGPVSGTLAAYWKSKLGLYSSEMFMAWLEGLGVAPARSTREDQFLETGNFRWVKPREVLTKTAVYAHGSSRYPELGARRASSGMHTKIRADVPGPSRSSLQAQTIATPDILNWLPVTDERQWPHRDL
ncbi:hypothetical protein H072_8583 [Dactylellina haptotyla CBS 200.50]|uniref:Uncharacterized protein n=1 Tax=Dactylellina haptotyla (strain CBS 200.50) TaxID=1284197 RepID=S8BEP1_DACHA|nr:hypothetical protein H072_8583 [Dactylellina haptotyla CBS 200.50]